MEPTSNSSDQAAPISDAKRKGMIHSVQALAQRLSVLESKDYDLGSANSEAAQLVARIAKQVSAIALTETPDETGWDKNYLFDVMSGGYVISSVAVNPLCDTRLSKREWADVERKEYLLQAIARKKFVESISIEPA